MILHEQMLSSRINEDKTSILEQGHNDFCESYADQGSWLEQLT